MAGEFLTAKTTFSINGTVIAGLKSYPKMATARKMVDVTTMDDEENERSIPGLRAAEQKDFRFLNQTANFDSAKSTENAESNEYELAFPNGGKYTWEGTHTADIESGETGDPNAFTISCLINSKLEYTPGTSV